MNTKKINKLMEIAKKSSIKDILVGKHFSENMTDVDKCRSMYIRCMGYYLPYWDTFTDKDDVVNLKKDHHNKMDKVIKKDLEEYIQVFES